MKLFEGSIAGTREGPLDGRIGYGVRMQLNSERVLRTLAERLVLSPVKALTAN